MAKAAWNPTIACTPQKIRKQIAECEALTIAAGLKGDKQVEKEKQRLEEVFRKREEILQNHKEVIAKMTEEHDTSLRTMVHKTKSDLEECANVQRNADEERMRMQAKADDLEKKKVILEKEVKRLYSLLDKLQKEFDQRRNMMMDVAEDTVRESFHCTAEDVRTTALFAQEVQVDAFMAIDRMQEEIKSTSEVADAMAESRSRFEALHKVGASRTIKGISEASFQTEKQEIMQKWWSDWEGHITSLTPGPPSLAQITASRPDTPMVPSIPRPRSVELARQKAEVQSLANRVNVLPSVVIQDDRPQTAP
mmetsp:Transcript_67302/g.82463  ORF Transcript_67302/g.82463 Transcript_67302/m.82463 type:complete len:308 (+) Transcript_67302:55-978(+)